MESKAVAVEWHLLVRVQCEEEEDAKTLFRKALGSGHVW